MSDEAKVIIQRVPAKVRPYVWSRRALAQFDWVRWTERDGVLWITTCTWMLAVPEGSPVDDESPSDWAFWHLDRQVPPPVERGESREIPGGKKSDRAIRFGQAWVAAHLVGLVEDVHGGVSWCGEGPLDGVYAVKHDKPVAVLMPMRIYSEKPNGG